VRLHARVNGVGLGRRDVPVGVEFEMVWPLPDAMSAADVVEVDLRCHPGFRPSVVPFRGDRRRLGFQLRAITIE
jgi:hypothetical protein